MAKAARLWETFGETLYGILGAGEAAPLVPLLGPDLADSLVQAWKRSLGEADVVVWMDEHGFDAGLALKAVSFWGERAAPTLRANPYVLMAVAPWPKVDAVGRRIGVAREDPRRETAAVEAVLYGRLERGHTWTASPDLEAGVRRLLGSTPDRAAQAVGTAAWEGAAVPCEGGYQPVGAHVMERYVADRIASLLEAPSTEDLLSGSRATAAAGGELPAASQTGGITLNDGQRSAVRSAVNGRLTLLLGGAGVGKTTVLGAVHDIAERCGLTVVQMALAGRAAMRMREATGRPARTIAGFLRSCDRGHLTVGTDHLVVVDEASMLDLPLLYAILRRLGGGARLLLVGDPGQLPPIGFGLTFHLLAGVPWIPKVELTQVHRQAAETGIPAVADAIRRGDPPELPDWDPSMRRGVSFLECDRDAASGAVTRVLHASGRSGGETRIISAVRAGPAGVNGINRHLHILRARGKPTVPGRSLAVGDPLLFTRNDWDRELFNGSLGELLAIGAAGRITASFDGREMEFGPEDLPDISLAYCLTVHKAQGSQFRRVVMPVFRTGLLDRALLYTAVTRATDQVVLVGSRAEFAAAVRAPSASMLRETGLTAMLSDPFCPNV